MNRFFTFLALTAVLFMSACGTEDVKPEPFEITEVKLEPVYSLHSNDGFTIGVRNPFSLPLKVYTGDTLTYKILYAGKQELANVQVFKVVDGTESPVPVFNQEVSPAKEVTATYKYVVSEQAGATLKLVLKLRDKEGKPISTTFGQLPNATFTLQAPLSYEQKRVYNIKGDLQNSFELNRTLYRQDLKENSFDSMYAFLINASAGAATDKAFVPGFRAGTAMPQVHFVKAPAGAFTLPDGVNRLVKDMQEWGAPQQEIQNVQAGEVYAFKAKYNTDDSFVVYGLLRITEVLNDNSTSAQGGHDNDYIQFDMKYYPGYRF